MNEPLAKSEWPVFAYNLFNAWTGVAFLAFGMGLVIAAASVEGFPEMGLIISPVPCGFVVGLAGCFRLVAKQPTNALRGLGYSLYTLLCVAAIYVGYQVVAMANF